MRKVSVPIAVLIFLMSASPVFAASFWDNFGSIFNFFRFGTYRSASVSSVNRDGFSTFTQTTTPPPRPTNLPRPTESGKPNLFLPPAEGIRPTGFGRPTDNVKPTKETQPDNNGNGGGNGNSNGSQGNQDNAKANRAQKTQDVVNRMLDSYQKRLDKYNDFLTKVKSRRDKLAADGKDVSNLDAFIATATDNWNAAQTVFTNVKSALGALDYTGDMGPLRKSIHDELTKLRQALTTLHKSMSETVSEILGLSAGTTVTPKPTKGNNGQQNNGKQGNGPQGIKDNGQK